MQPYVILKRPGKAIFYLIIIMLSFLVKDTLGLRCTKPCFGPVSQVRLFNELTKNYIVVVGDRVVADPPKRNSTTLYKISSGEHFYLFDKQAKKFICWKKKKATLVPLKYERAHKRMYLCKFKEMLSSYRNETHVEFIAGFNENLKMTFNKRGKPMMRRCNNNNHVRHKTPKDCVQAAAFLVAQDKCECPEAKNIFCSKGLRDMEEFKNSCRDMNNESLENS